MQIELTTREAWAVAEVIKGRKNLTAAYDKITRAARADETAEQALAIQRRLDGDFECAIERANRPHSRRCNQQCPTCIDIAKELF